MTQQQIINARLGLDNPSQPSPAATLMGVLTGDNSFDEYQQQGQDLTPDSFSHFTGKTYSNANKIWNEQAPEEMQQDLSDAVDQQIFSGADLLKGTDADSYGRGLFGGSYQEDIDPNKQYQLDPETHRPVEFDGGAKNLYHAINPQGQYKVGVAQENFDERYADNRRPLEKLLDIRLPEDVAIEEEAMTHGNSNALRQRVYDLGDKKGQQMFGSGYTELYESNPIAMQILDPEQQAVATAMDKEVNYDKSNNFGFDDSDSGKWYTSDSQSAGFLRGLANTGVNYANVLGLLPEETATRILQKLEAVTEAHKATGRTPEREAEINALQTEYAKATGFDEKLFAGFNSLVDAALNPSEWQVGEFIGEQVDPLNALAFGKGLSAVGKTALATGAQQGAFTGARTDKSAEDALVDATLGTAAGAGIGGTMHIGSRSPKTTLQEISDLPAGIKETAGDIAHPIQTTKRKAQEFVGGAKELMGDIKADYNQRFPKETTVPKADNTVSKERRIDDLETAKQYATPEKQVELQADIDDINTKYDLRQEVKANQKFNEPIVEEQTRQAMESTDSEAVKNIYKKRLAEGNTPEVVAGEQHRQVSVARERIDQDISATQSQLKRATDEAGKAELTERIAELQDRKAKFSSATDEILIEMKDPRPLESDVRKMMTQLKVERLKELKKTSPNKELVTKMEVDYKHLQQLKKSAISNTTDAVKIAEGEVWLTRNSIYSDTRGRQYHGQYMTDIQGDTFAKASQRIKGKATPEQMRIVERQEAEMSDAVGRSTYKPKDYAGRRVDRTELEHLSSETTAVRNNRLNNQLDLKREKAQPKTEDYSIDAVVKNTEKSLSSKLEAFDKAVDNIRKKELSAGSEDFNIKQPSTYIRNHTKDLATVKSFIDAKRDLEDLKAGDITEETFRKKAFKRTNDELNKGLYSETFTPESFEKYADHYVEQHKLFGNKVERPTMDKSQLEQNTKGLSDDSKAWKDEQNRLAQELVENKRETVKHDIKTIRDGFIPAYKEAWEPITKSQAEKEGLLTPGGTIEQHGHTLVKESELPEALEKYEADKKRVGKEKYDDDFKQLVEAKDKDGNYVLSEDELAAFDKPDYAYGKNRKERQKLSGISDEVFTKVNEAEMDKLGMSDLSVKDEIEVMFPEHSIMDASNSVLQMIASLLSSKKLGDLSKITGLDDDIRVAIGKTMMDDGLIKKVDDFIAKLDC